MDPNKHPLSQPYGVFLWLAKSGAFFSALTGAFLILCELSDYLNAKKQAFASEPLALPVLMCGFVAIHLFYEVIMHGTREEMERLRSSPIHSRLVGYNRPGWLTLAEKPEAANDESDPTGLES